MLARAGVHCAPASSASSPNDPVGVELAGAAKNAAALAAGATEAQGLNAAGAAAGHIFAEVWRYAEGMGARPESMIGLAGAGDLVATALARESRNRRAGELLAAGVPAGEIPERIGQAVEALESVPLLAAALERAGVAAPVTGALGRLISGELPLDEWVALVAHVRRPPWRVAEPGSGGGVRSPETAARGSRMEVGPRGRRCGAHGPWPRSQFTDIADRIRLARPLSRAAISVLTTAS